MKRASWKGQFHLGNLVIPVKLYSATMPAGPEFMQVHKSDMAPVKRRLVCSRDGEELTAKDVVRAVENDGTLVSVEQIDEIGPHVSRDLIVRQFTDITHVHSLYYDKPYYLLPDKGGEMAYVTLRNALKKADKLAVVTYNMYGRAHIGVIGPSDGAMILQQLKYATELVDTKDIKQSALPQPSPDQVDLAVRLINKYTTEFYLEDYRNEQLDAVQRLVERAVKGLPTPKDTHEQESPTPQDELTAKLAGLVNQKESTLL